MSGPCPSASTGLFVSKSRCDTGLPILRPPDLETLSVEVRWRLDGRKVVRSLTRMHVATVPALAYAVAVTVAAGIALRPGPMYGLVTVLVGGGGAVLLYLRFSKALGVNELPDLARTIAARFGRPPGAHAKG